MCGNIFINRSIGGEKVDEGWRRCDYYGSVSERGDI